MLCFHQRPGADRRKQSFVAYGPLVVVEITLQHSAPRAWSSCGEVNRGITLTSAPHQAVQGTYLSPIFGSNVFAADKCETFDKVFGSDSLVLKAYVFILSWSFNSIFLN